MTPTPTASDSARRPLWAAAALLGLVAAGFAAWLWAAPVASAVLAQGRLKVVGDVKTVQHLDGGIVRQLHIADGAQVSAGQALLELDTTDIRANLAAMVSERDALAARSLRLRAQLAGGAAPDFSGLSGGPDLADAIAGQQAIWAAQASEMAAEAAMRDGKITRLTRRLEAQEAQLAGTLGQREIVEQDAATARDLQGSGLMTKVALNSRERELASLRGNEAALHAQIAETRAAQDEARLAHAQARSTRIARLSGELSDVSASLAGLSPAIEAELDRLDRSVLRAPVDGTVVDLRLSTLGGVIAPGEPVLKIVPQTGELVAEVRVAPKDREQLRAGMPAVLRLAGVRHRGDQGITGEIRMISAETTRDPEQGKAGADPSFAMQIAFAAPPEGVRLEPGMPITGVVPIAERSALDYLMSPLTDAVQRSMRED